MFQPEPDDTEAEEFVDECAHGRPRRHCASCLARWVDDLLDTQTWRNREMRSIVAENRRLRRLLAEQGIENP